MSRKKGRRKKRRKKRKKLKQKDMVIFNWDCRRVELTNEISVGWVQSTMGAETVAFWEETVAYSIENLINPVSIPLIIGE